MNADQMYGSDVEGRAEEGQAQVEEHLRTPEYKAWQEEYVGQTKALRYLQSGLAQQMLKLRGIKDMMGMQAQKVKELFQSKPAKPINELANQPRRNV